MNFFTVLCRLPGSPIKKNTLINFDMVKYMAPNNQEGTETLIFIGNGDYLVAYDTIENIAAHMVEQVKNLEVLKQACEITLK